MLPLATVFVMSHIVQHLIGLGACWTICDITNTVANGNITFLQESLLMETASMLEPQGTGKTSYNRQVFQHTAVTFRHLTRSVGSLKSNIFHHIQFSVY